MHKPSPDNESLTLGDRTQANIWIFSFLLSFLGDKTFCFCVSISVKHLQTAVCIYPLSVMVIVRTVQKWREKNYVCEGGLKVSLSPSFKSFLSRWFVFLASLKKLDARQMQNKVFLESHQTKVTEYQPLCGEIQNIPMDVLAWKMVCVESINQQFWKWLSLTLAPSGQSQ